MIRHLFRRPDNTGPAHCGRRLTSPRALFLQGIAEIHGNVPVCKTCLKVATKRYERTLV